jgi:hypothetical protein
MNLKKWASIICIMVLFLLSSSFASAQGGIIDFPFFRAADDVYENLDGGILTFYEVGTTTKKDVYSDRTLQTVAANPYTISSEGGAILYGSGYYKIDLTDSDGVQQEGFPIDYVYVAAGNASVGVLNVYYPDATAADQGVDSGVTVPSVKYYVDLIGTSNQATLYFQHDSGASRTYYTFSTSETVPDNISSMAEDGAVIRLTNSAVATLGKRVKPVGTNLTQVYEVDSGSTVTFLSSADLTYFPEHWGVLNDLTVDSSDAFDDMKQSMIASGGGKIILTGKYRHDGLYRLKGIDNLTIEGLVESITDNTEDISLIHFGENGDNVDGLKIQGINGISLKNFILDYESDYGLGAASGSLCQVEDVNNGVIENVMFRNGNRLNTIGLQIGNSTSDTAVITSKIDTCYFQGGVRGIHLTPGNTSLTILNCFASGQTGSVSYGYLVEDVNYCTLISCAADGFALGHPAEPLGTFPYGVDAADNVTFISCGAENYGQAGWRIFDGANFISLIDCFASGGNISGNTAIGTFADVGISGANVANISIINPSSEGLAKPGAASIYFHTARIGGGVNLLGIDSGSFDNEGAANDAGVTTQLSVSGDDNWQNSVEWHQGQYTSTARHSFSQYSRWYDPVEMNDTTNMSGLQRKWDTDVDNTVVTNQLVLEFTDTGLYDKIIGVQIRVDEALRKADGSIINFDVAYGSGLGSLSIATTVSGTTNTKLNRFVDLSGVTTFGNVATAGVDVILSGTTETLFSGDVTGTLFYEDFTDLIDDPS